MDSKIKTTPSRANRSLTFEALFQSMMEKISAHLPLSQLQYYCTVGHIHVHAIAIATCTTQRNPFTAVLSVLSDII
jgi:hypothetical protein